MGKLCVEKTKFVMNAQFFAEKTASNEKCHYAPDDLVNAISAYLIDKNHEAYTELAK